ncbi:MAG: flagellar biosynthetic protein FliO [Terracidiphilus sp.]
MTTETLRVSGSIFRDRTIALWRRVLRLRCSAPKRLRLCESLPLGEHRFVAVVEFDTALFLVGGTPSSLVLLSRLGDAEEPAEGRQQDNASWKALTTSALTTSVGIRPVEKC